MTQRVTTPKKKQAATEGEDDMQLIQIGDPEPQKTVSIREMFEQLAKREEEMIRQGRERLKNHVVTTA